MIFMKLPLVPSHRFPQISILSDPAQVLVMSVGVAGAAITALAESETKNEETQQGHLGIGRLAETGVGVGVSLT